MSRRRLRRWAVEKFEPYVKTTHFTVFTDHENLRYMSTACAGKVQRWAIYLQQFDMDTVLIGGTLDAAADFLSRAGFSDVDEDWLIEEMAAPAFVLAAYEAPLGFAPSLPTAVDLKEWYPHVSDDERRDTYYGEDGIA